MLYKTLFSSKLRTRQVLFISSLLVLLSVFQFNQIVEASQTDTYVFDPNQSTVVKTGGFAGVHETYSILGQFRLITDVEDGLASFVKVNADLIDQKGSVYNGNLGDIFNMTSLLGTIVEDTTIRFEGKTNDGTDSDVQLTLDFREDSAHLTGTITPPANSADMFFYELDAVVLKKFGGGSGESDNPYLIYTVDQLNVISAEPNDWDKHFKLMVDIDLSDFLYDTALIAPVAISENNDPIQGIPFTGIFDGNGHTISNLMVLGESYLGLFGQVTSKAKIMNLGVVDVNIVGSGDYVGGLVGLNEYGELNRCFSSGQVSSDTGVGGLVGYNGFGGRVLRSYSTSSVSGQKETGGLVGLNDGEISRCYSVGAVTAMGTDALGIGGLVGYGGTVNQSFWDIETSGRIASKGGIGMTTASMQTAMTFLKAGWDFVDETENGTEDIWRIDEGKDYPRLTWELAKDGLMVSD